MNVTAIHSACSARILEAEVREVEMTHANAIHQRDAQNCGRDASEPFEAEPHVRPAFDLVIVLLDHDHLAEMPLSRPCRTLARA